MSRLDSCSTCDGFVPLLAKDCPHCGTPRSKLARRALGATLGGAVAMTLMACYGAPETGPMATPKGSATTNPKAKTSASTKTKPLTSAPTAKPSAKSTAAPSASASAAPK